MKLIATLLEPRLADLRAAIEALDPLADAFEIRLDALEEDVPPSAIRALTRKPLVATNRRKGEGGHYAADEHPRLERLDACLEAGFEYADVEGPTSLHAPEEKLIRSRHDFHATPTAGTLVRWGEEASRNGAIFKAATHASGFSDIVAILAAARQLSREHLPHALMGMGDFPRPLMALVGAELIYGGGRTNAPGQPTLASIRETLRHWGHPPSATSMYLVVGNPIDHSLSPRLHNAALRTEAIDAAYGALRVANSFELQLLLEHAESLGLAGLSVTTPLKDAAHGLAATRTPEADAAKAVNCIAIREGNVVGHNTDGLGAARVVARLVDAKDARILVLGTGGAARAIASQLSGYRVTLAGRRPADLAKLGQTYGCATVPLGYAGEAVAQADLVINATRAQEPIQLDETKAALFDLLYGEAPTAWEMLAQRKGLPFAGGRELLLEQARVAFEFWHHRTAPMDAMRSAVEAPP